jgi:hypothetical protein
MSRLHCALYTIPLHRPWWQRVWIWLQLRNLRAKLECLQDERDGYVEAASMPGSEFKLGEKYLANCAEQESELKARIAVLEVLL